MNKYFKKTKEGLRNPLNLYFSILITGGLIGTNAVGIIETSNKIKAMPTIERKVSEAQRLKNDLHENWYFTPFLLGEYFTANYYLNKHEQ